VGWRGPPAAPSNFPSEILTLDFEEFHTMEDKAKERRGKKIAGSSKKAVREG
jgi:hypothetical protein